MVSIYQIVFYIKRNGIVIVQQHSRAAHVFQQIAKDINIIKQILKFYWTSPYLHSFLLIRKSNLAALMRTTDSPFNISYFSGIKRHER